MKVQSVGLAAFGPINPHTAGPAHAAAAFGKPDSAVQRGSVCSRHWTGLGLTIEFGVGEGEDPCGSRAGIERITVAGSVAADAGWRTAEGIRPGMSLTAVRRIYPEAGRQAGRELVLVEPAPGAGPGRIPVLTVTIDHGRVDGLIFPIGGG
ncbi:MAG TPA: hypothetical protein VNP96_05005 [Solirubrobacterales bacterium]|nr:hypothetical protein [Solirubrobacterales bacterium]